MTTLAGGFSVTNYHDSGRKISKSSLDRKRKQKRPLRQTALTLGVGDIKIFFLCLSFQTKQSRDHFHSALEKDLKISSGRQSKLYGF